MKASYIILLILGLFHISAEDGKHPNTYICTTGKTQIYASTPLEDITPVSDKTICALNTLNKKISAKLEMKTLIFKNGLMQEHFNENYIESDKYPFGSLDARIKENIDFTKDGVYDVTLLGTLDLHGVKKDREIKGKLTIKNGQPSTASAEFMLKLVDHKIKIPTAVVVKIAEEVKVNVDFKFQKYEK